MTYLNLVNEVLKRLRETQVSSVSATSYSSMVGAFVNDAKDEVEEAWLWGVLRSIITVTTADGTNTYALTGFGDQGKVIGVWDNTNNVGLLQVSQTHIDRMKYTGNTSDGPPRFFTFRGEDASGDAQIELYPTPDAVYDIKVNTFVPQDSLSGNTDELSVPWRPVMLQALALLSEERGETGGQPTARAFAQAQKSLSSAIAIDAERYPVETTWFEE